MIISIQSYHSSAGELILGEFQGKLCMCDWKYREQRKQIDMRILKGFNATFLEQNTELLEQVKIQLDEYFDKKRTKFDVPLVFVGTDFQKSVWEALMEIPYGTTKGYLELSRYLGDENAIRAVATAIGANSVSIFVPCHRIIGSDGSLTGYAGGLNAKKNLLELEGMLFGDQLSLFD